MDEVNLILNGYGTTTVPIGSVKTQGCIGLYFSSAWCGPCRDFTPLLRRFVNNIRETTDKTFQIIFVSLDNSKSDMLEYFHNHHGQWLAVPYNHDIRKFMTEEKYDIRNIPKLLILDPEWNIITDNGVDEIQNVSMNPERFGLLYTEWVNCQIKK